jgi:phospholipase C
VASIASTGGAQAQPATSSPIKHVVVIYQENHSFDNVLGDLCVVDKRCDGSIGPMTLQGSGTARPHIATDVIPRVDHDVQAQTTAIDGGKMDGWANVNGCQSPAFRCLTYYTPDQIPALASLARRFTIADHIFQENDAPSWGAHLSLATGGTLDGFVGDNPLPTPGQTLGPGWGCDSNRSTDWVSPTGVILVVPSCVPDRSLNRPNGGAFAPTPVAQVPTIMDRLDAARLSWKIYSPQAQGTFGRGYVWAICPTFAECLYTSQSSGLVQRTNVLSDASAGKLPAFSIVTPDLPISQHNDTSMAAGDNWIGQVVSAIENGPDWNSTAIFITYDDCGCFYDHVAPPNGEGIRAPVVIVSPYARPAFTDTTPGDVVGSILAYVEHNFSIPSLTSVDGNAYDFSGAFNYSQVPLTARSLPKPTPTTPVTLTESDYSDVT